MGGFPCESDLPYPSIFYFTALFRLHYHIDPMTEVYNISETYLSYIIESYI